MVDKTGRPVGLVDVTDVVGLKAEETESAECGGEEGCGEGARVSGRRSGVGVVSRKRPTLRERQ